MNQANRNAGIRSLHGARLTAVLALALAACGTPAAERNIRLDPPLEMLHAAKPLDGSLQIAPFSARGLLSDRHLAYVDLQSPAELKQSASLLWEETPQDAAALIITRALRVAQAAPAVFATDQPGTASYTLSARLDRFELVQRPGGSAAVVALEVTVLQGKDRAPFLIAAYCAEQPSADGGLGGVEAAFDEAFRRILASLTQDISAEAAGMRPNLSLAAGRRDGPC